MTWRSSLDGFEEAGLGTTFYFLRNPVRLSETAVEAGAWLAVVSVLVGGLIEHYRYPIRSRPVEPVTQVCDKEYEKDRPKIRT